MSYTLSWEEATTDVEETITYFDATADNYPTDSYPTMGLSYMLYDNPTDWDSFKSYVDDDTNTPTTIEEANRTAYSSYSLRLICDVTDFTTQDGSGCCLMDATSGDYGGYCILYNDNSGSPTADTYYIGATDWDDCISAYAIDSTYQVEDDADGDVGF